MISAPSIDNRLTVATVKSRNIYIRVFIQSRSIVKLYCPASFRFTFTDAATIYNIKCLVLYNAVYIMHSFINSKKEIGKPRVNHLYSFGQSEKAEL